MEATVASVLQRFLHAQLVIEGGNPPMRLAKIWVLKQNKGKTPKMDGLQ